MFAAAARRRGMALVLRSSSTLPFAAGSSSSKSSPLPFAAGAGRSITGLFPALFSPLCRTQLINKRALRIDVSGRQIIKEAGRFQIPSSKGAQHIHASGPRIKEAGSFQRPLTNRRALHVEAASDPQTPKVKTLEAQLAECLAEVLSDKQGPPDCETIATDLEAGGVPSNQADAIAQVLSDNIYKEGPPDRETIARNLEAGGVPSQLAEALAQVYCEVRKGRDKLKRPKYMLLMYIREMEDHMEEQRKRKAQASRESTMIANIRKYLTTLVEMGKRKKGMT